MGTPEEKYWELFLEVANQLPRGGPGNNAMTLRALHMIPDLPPQPTILDIGCGQGMQTIALAQATDGKIIGLDNYAAALETFKKKIDALLLGTRVIAQLGDMARLDFSKEHFDLLWAEGAIYNIGFEKGLISWRSFLKPGGYLMASEAVWLKPHAVRELTEFWQQEYPGMTDVPTCLELIAASGYALVGHFTLPEAVWWESYYTPMEQQIKKLKEKYHQDAEALAVIPKIEREIEMFRKYSEYWGYEYFICRNQ